MTMCPASARGAWPGPYIFCGAIGKAEKGELLVRFCGAQRSKEQRQGIFTYRDRKPRQANAGEFRNAGFGGREALCVGCRKVHHETDDCQWLERNLADSKPAHLDQSGEGFSGAREQPAVY